MTTQQYNACWKERIESEQKALAAAIDEEAKPDASAPATADDTASVSNVSRASNGSRVSKGSRAPSSVVSVQSSVVSSRVSTNTQVARKLELLQLKLDEERRKRKELEQALKAAQQAGS